jgi:hypothetical protein
VANAPGAGPTTGPMTVTVPVPGGLTLESASGPGWTCSTANATATCSRSDPLQPGSSYPPLTVNVDAGPEALGQIPVTVTGSTPGDANPQSLTGIDVISAIPLPPDLSMNVTSSGPFTAGGTGQYDMTVSNADGAGPTNGTVTAILTVPAGVTVSSAAGTGWTCSVSGVTVTCTRPGTGTDALGGGSSYPPVQVTVAIPSGASGTVNATASAGTAGNTGTPGETAQTPVTITQPSGTGGQSSGTGGQPSGTGGQPSGTGGQPSGTGGQPSGTGGQLPPQVTASVTPPVGGLTGGQPGTYTITVSNAPGAGPAAGPQTVTFDIPSAVTVTAAGGDGWSCSQSGKVITCTAPGTLQPGASLPPLQIEAETPASIQGTVTVTTSVQSPGNGATTGTQVSTLTQVTAAPANPGGTGGTNPAGNGSCPTNSSTGAVCISVGSGVGGGSVNVNAGGQLTASAGSGIGGVPDCGVNSSGIYVCYTGN